MKNNQNISHQVQLIVAEALNLSIEEINPQASQENFIDWDSFAYLSIVSSIEDKFEISINEENIEKFGSIPDIVDVILKCKTK